MFLHTQQASFKYVFLAILLRK